MAISTRTAGWVKIPNAAAGVPALGVGTGDPCKRYPLIFGLGACDSGRVSTSTRAGAALSFPDAYSFGEAWELRWNFPETGNNQRQGIFLEVRGTAANSSTIRGAEISAAQCGAVAIGTIEGANIHAQTRSATTGNVTNLFGVTGEVGHNSADYTGTVTAFAAVRAKASVEDGATYTYGSIFRGEIEGITGGKAINAGLSMHASGRGTVNYLLDTSGIESTNYSANRVVLWKFKDSAGTDRFLVYDADAATSVLVDTNETE